MDGADGSSDPQPPVPAAGALDAPPADDADPRGLTSLLLLAALGGVLAGLLGGAFRWVLEHAALWRDDVLHWAREVPVARAAVPVVLALVAVAVARSLVRLSPESSGSGVQRVEAAIRGEAPTPGPRVIPVKFAGGALALGSGLALGREGPTVQMAGAIGTVLARWRRLTPHDTRTLSVALAGAGLGVAFNAPLGGALFAFEEVARAFRTRLVITTLVGTGAAVATASLLVGGGAVLRAGEVEAGPIWQLAVYALAAVLLGALGVAYNRLVVACLDVVAALRRLPPEVPAAVMGAAIGLLGVAAPELVGEGGVLTERVLLTTVPLGTMLLWLVVRWFLGPASYAPGAPGGLFAPLLLVGALAGALVAGAIDAVVPSAGLSTTAFAIVGMSTFFAAVVRAPITGVVLIMEMTATTSVAVPMIVAAVIATWTATVLRGEPIYETLRARMGGDQPPKRLERSA